MLTLLESVRTTYDSIADVTQLARECEHEYDFDCPHAGTTQKLFFHALMFSSGVVAFVVP